METNINTPETQKKIKLDFKESKYATGRRKRSIAKVWLKKGSGSIYVNGKKMSEYFFGRFADLISPNSEKIISNDKDGSVEIKRVKEVKSNFLNKYIYSGLIILILLLVAIYYFL